MLLPRAALKASAPGHELMAPVIRGRGTIQIQNATSPGGICTMWNQKPAYPSKNPSSNEPLAETPRPAESPVAVRETSIAARVTTLPSQNVSVIGKGLTITGAITGTEPLHVEGNVKGSIRLDPAYLNIGPQATVQ